jgi:hypothetical protein
MKYLGLPIDEKRPTLSAYDSVGERMAKNQSASKGNLLSISDRGIGECLLKPHYTVHVVFVGDT